MTKKALAYVFIYGVTVGALVLALTPVSPRTIGLTVDDAPAVGVVRAVQVSFDGPWAATAAPGAERCPYLAAGAAAGRCPYLAAMAAAAARGTADENPPESSCPVLRDRRDGRGEAQGIVEAVLPAAAASRDEASLPL